MSDARTAAPLLMGLPAIATYLGITHRQARSLNAKGVLPTFRLPRSTLTCARPEILDAWLAAQEAQALKR